MKKFTSARDAKPEFEDGATDIAAKPCLVGAIDGDDAGLSFPLRHLYQHRILYPYSHPHHHPPLLRSQPRALHSGCLRAPHRFSDSPQVPDAHLSLLFSPRDYYYLSPPLLFSRSSPPLFFSLFSPLLVPYFCPCFYFLCSLYVGVVGKLSSTGGIMGPAVPCHVIWMGVPLRNTWQIHNRLTGSNFIKDDAT